jgi:type I restriction enzyme, S subunit
LSLVCVYFFGGTPAHIDHIIETINRQIETLRELRKMLINDVVTGKIKVIA